MRADGISCIYTLSCPFTGNIVYVGYTKDYQQRKYQHEHGYGSCEINKWERYVLSQGLKPIIEILDMDSSCEQYWIEQITAWGFELLNSFWSYQTHTVRSIRYAPRIRLQPASANPR
jgi:hypothetical protein